MLLDVASPFDISKKNLIEAIDYSTQNNMWLNTPHEGMNNLTIDQSGKVGEKTFYEWCAQCKDINISYDEKNTNQPDGVYEGSIALKGQDIVDIKVTNPRYLILTEKVRRYKYRYENKTARLGKDLRFQHENVKTNVDCDIVFLIDYTPFQIYLTVLDSNFDVTNRHPVFGCKPHMRKENKSCYKFDLSLSQIRKGIDAGITMEVTQDTPLGDVHNFIKKFLI